MKQVILDRTESGDEGTFGWLRVLDEVTGEERFACATLELPHRGNAHGLSCVDPGQEIFDWRVDSPKHGGVYQARPRNGREFVQIHAANLAGDESKGYVKQLDGCIALGTAVVKFRAGNRPAGSRDQRGLSASKSTVAAFVDVLGKESFVLTIKDAA